MKTPNRSATMRQKILDEAYQIVLHQGIDQLSMRTIASAVKCSPATLYQYFACKEEIVEELHSKLLTNLAHHLNLLDKQLSPDVYLEQIGIAYLEFAQAHATLFKLTWHATPESSFSRPNQAHLKGDDPNPLPAFRRHWLYTVLHEAVALQHKGTANASPMQAADIQDRTLAFWSLLQGYVSLLAQTSCPEYAARTWKRLYHQLFLPSE
jgi:AcrR family transcriptional regulator